jgi:hypothetical protein
MGLAEISAGMCAIEVHSVFPKFSISSLPIGAIKSPSCQEKLGIKYVSLADCVALQAQFMLVSGLRKKRREIEELFILKKIFQKPESGFRAYIKNGSSKCR